MLLVHTSLIYAAPVGKRTWRQQGLLLGPASQDKARSPQRGKKFSFTSPLSLSPTCSFIQRPLTGCLLSLWSLRLAELAHSSRCGLAASSSVKLPVPPPVLPYLPSLPMAFAALCLRLPPPPPSSGQRSGPGVVLTQILSGPWSWMPDFCTLGSSLMMRADSDSDSEGLEDFPAAAPW